MKIPLREFRSTEGVARELYLEENWEPTVFNGQPIKFNNPVILQFELENHSQVLLVNGTVKAELVLECSRCMDSFTHKLSVQLEDRIPLTAGDDSDEYWSASYINRDRDEIDLSEYSQLALLENLPLQPLCDLDCKGLCSICGQNQNQSRCSCNQLQVDPRLVVLSQLLKKNDSDK